MNGLYGDIYGLRLSGFPKCGVPFTPIMENEMDKKLENEMETGTM